MGLFDNLSSFATQMKKAMAAAPFIAAAVAFAESTEADAATKKAGVMAAWDVMEKEIGFDWDDRYVSTGIEVLYRLGKLTGILKSSGDPSTPALSSTASKKS